MFTYHTYLTRFILGLCRARPDVIEPGIIGLFCYPAITFIIEKALCYIHHFVELNSTLHGLLHADICTDAIFFI